MSSIYDKDENRVKALARAAQMMRLFNQKSWGTIMKEVATGNSNLEKFKIACKKVEPPLADAEMVWLWNYLKHCGDAWSYVPEAAQSGW